MDHKTIEAKWQKFWQDNKTYEVNEDTDKPKYYCLEMFPYPSGKLHMGHVRNYSIGDVVARYKKLNGYNVLHPIGWDSFGLPAENAAIKHGVHPKEWTFKNIETMRSQLKTLGLSYDWSRELATCHQDYYKWEQLLFTKMFKKYLAYKKKSSVNWCSSCGTVLANEQVENGKCWRCEETVTTKELSQWFFRITDYAEELLSGCDELSGLWPERVLTMQKNWIGKSIGVELDFKIKNSNELLKIYTTRPDTIYGVTFVSLAPEHPLVLELSKGTKQELEILAFIEKIRKTTKIERLAEGGLKEGVFTGAYAINPLTNEEVPIYTANFVLMDFGTGAVMAVPAHDQRDFEFAKKYNLKIKEVIYKDTPNSPQTCAYTESGTMINSAEFSGTNSLEAKEKIADFIENKKIGKRTVNYRLKDWGVSRQRFWGCPIPIIYCSECGMVPVPEEDLPVLLPENVKFENIGDDPLKKVKNFINVKCPKCGIPAKRETETFDTFVESSWYYARYTSPKDTKQPLDINKTKYWLPVDQYIGGIEHAILHLIYIRFFHKMLRDFGDLEGNEPVKKLLTQGMVIKDGFKMSKSKGNVVDPDYIIEKFGADTARLFCLFASPPEKDLDWSDLGVEGSYRFIQRVSRFIKKFAAYTKNNKKTFDISKLSNTEIINLYSDFNKCLKKFTFDLEELHFNTAIASMMEFLNILYKLDEKLFTEDSEAIAVLSEILKAMLVMLMPFIPHTASELWESVSEGSIENETWPKFNEAAIFDAKKTIVVQINGKIRAKLELEPDCDEETVKTIAFGEKNIIKNLEGTSIVKTIFVKDRLLNIVVK